MEGRVRYAVYVHPIFNWYLSQMISYTAIHKWASVWNNKWLLIKNIIYFPGFTKICFFLSFQSNQHEKERKNFVCGNHTRYVKIEWMRWLRKFSSIYFIVYKYHNHNNNSNIYLCDIKYNWDLNNGMNEWYWFFARFVAFVVVICDAEKKGTPDT